MSVREKLELFMDDDRRLSLAKKIWQEIPLGWANGKILRSQKTTDLDIIQWLCDLGNALKVDADGTDLELERLQEKYQTLQNNERLNGK